MTEGVPPVQYADADGVSIAYRVLGDGPLDLVWVPGLFQTIEVGWDGPLYRRLASFSRLMLFDKRGMGLSDRNVGVPTLEERMDDVRAVMDAVGSERAAFLGVSEGGPMSILFAATYPERTVALVLCGTTARFRTASDYPYGNEAQVAELRRMFGEGWGTGVSLRLIGSGSDDAERAELFGRMERAAGSPGTMRAMLENLIDIDVREVLPTISTPTLVLHGTSDDLMSVEGARWMAERIPGARFVELEGGHADAILTDRFADEVEAFLTGRRPRVATDRVLATVLFSDIVGSTEQAVAAGDRRWGELLDQHDSLVRRQVEGYRGRFVRSTGDGVLATFDGPARAVSCGCEIRDGVRSFGLDVRIGVHTGEIEIRGDDIGGIAVHIAKRVEALADTGQVLVSRTVTDLVTGSGLEFEDCGEHRLKGVPGTWRLYAVKT